MKYPADLSGTVTRRQLQHGDRWSSLGAQSGLLRLTGRLTPEELRRQEIFDGLKDELLEELSPDISVAVWAPGTTLFEAGTYIDLAFLVIEGEVELLVGTEEDASGQPIFDAALTDLQEHPTSPDPPLATLDQAMPTGNRLQLGSGEVFGEIGALSGWPQSVSARTVTEATLLQIRLPALRTLKRKSRALKRRLDTVYRERSLVAQLRSTPLLAGCDPETLKSIGDAAELLSFEPGDVVVREGAPADALFLVRSGFLRLEQPFGEGELLVGYLSKGMTLGEVELLVTDVDTWETTASSVEYSELVRIPQADFRHILASQPVLENRLWREATSRIKAAGWSRRHLDETRFEETALETGLIQGSSMLVLDLERCTRCDDCVRGCAAAHGGRPRFVREGERYENLLIARSCYHCKDPVCLVGCPTGAIHRAGTATVVDIDERICIGCSVCANNCPYDAIVMHDTGTSWPDDMLPAQLRGEPRAVASKCDLCHDTGHDPACVVNCPQGCATRVASTDEFQLLLERKR